MRGPHVRFRERRGGVIPRAYSTPLETICFRRSRSGMNVVTVDDGRHGDRAIRGR
jgi:hypothetical protein